jgi:hypothetical protein
MMMRLRMSCFLNCRLHASHESFIIISATHGILSGHPPYSHERSYEIMPAWFLSAGS